MGKISSNPSLNYTQNGGVELKATLGKGSWRKPLAMYAIFACSGTQDAQLLKLRAKPSLGCRDCRKSQKAEVGQRLPKLHTGT